MKICLDCRQKRSISSASMETDAKALFSIVGDSDKSSDLSSIKNCTEEALVAGLRNMTFDNVLGWKRVQGIKHPQLRLRGMTVRSDYESLGLEYKHIDPFHLNVVTDSGAQSCVWSLKGFLNSGFAITDLIPVDHSLKAANKVSIRIDGAIILRLSGEDYDTKHECAVMVFVSSDVDEFFLSEEAMKQLYIIPRDFPRVGAAKDVGNLNSVADQGCSDLSTQHNCPCPERTLPPGRPSHLPFPALPENIPKFEEWLKDRYSSSCFNQCPHQQLPEMRKTPPL